MKDARLLTAKDLTVGDKVHFLDVPYFSDDMRLSYVAKEVISINPTKSGKRVIITYNTGSTRAIGWNTPLDQTPAKFVEEIAAERGWK